MYENVFILFHIVLLCSTQFMDSVLETVFCSFGPSLQKCCAVDARHGLKWRCTGSSNNNGRKVQFKQHSSRRITHHTPCILRSFMTDAQTGTNAQKHTRARTDVHTKISLADLSGFPQFDFSQALTALVASSSGTGPTSPSQKVNQT